MPKITISIKYGLLYGRNLWIVTVKWAHRYIFKLLHPSAKFSGSENGHIREKIELHIHWMSDSRQSIIYKRMCKLQICRIYPKSQVKNIGEGCGNLEKQEICPNHALLRSYLKQAICQSNSLTLCMQHAKAASMEP